MINTLPLLNTSITLRSYRAHVCVCVCVCVENIKDLLSFYG